MSIGGEAREQDAAGQLVANERAKLTATYVNGLAVGLYVVGGVAPIFTYVFAAEASRPPIALIVLGSLVCQAASFGLHLWAKRFLRGLKP